MAEEKRYPVSELKREQLAKTGSVPHSREFLALGAVLGLGWSGYLLNALDLQEVIDSLKNLAVSSALSWDFAFFLAVTSAVLILPTWLLVTLFSLLQTKFNFAPKAIGFSVEDFGSLVPIFKPKIANAFWKVLLLFTWLLVGYLLTNYLFSEIFTYEATPKIDNLDSFRSGAKEIVFDSLFYIWITALFVVFFVGTLSLFLSRLSFDREHMMTRREVEDEAKEYESSPEVKQAQKELMS